LLLGGSDSNNIGKQANEFPFYYFIASGLVVSYAGTLGATGFLDDATGTSATFFEPTGITTDGNNLYISDYAANTVRKIQ